MLKLIIDNKTPSSYLCTFQKEINEAVNYVEGLVRFPQLCSENANPTASVNEPRWATWNTMEPQLVGVPHGNGRKKPAGRVWGGMA